MIAAKSIYRMRPMNDKTLEELSVPYLWFSRRCGFNDPNDANLTAFIDENDILLNRLKEKIGYKELEKLKKNLNYAGICCFTKELPSRKERCHFPNGKKSICVEYDVCKLQDCFKTWIYSLDDCFHDVNYVAEPLKIADDGEYHIISRIDSNGVWYESVLSLTRNERELKKLILLLLTRISSKYNKQKEQRIILSGLNIPCFSTVPNGYQIKIPNNAILRIHLYDTKNDATQAYFKEFSKHNIANKYEISWH